MSIPTAIYLMGTERVEHAAREIVGASECIERALDRADIPRCVERFEGALGALREVLAAHDKRRGK